MYSRPSVSSKPLPTNELIPFTLQQARRNASGNQNSDQPATHHITAHAADTFWHTRQTHDTSILSAWNSKSNSIHHDHNNMSLVQAGVQDHQTGKDHAQLVYAPKASQTITTQLIQEYQELKHTKQQKTKSTRIPELTDKQLTISSSIHRSQICRG